jgi:hypothetical protein
MTAALLCLLVSGLAAAIVTANETPMHQSVLSGQQWAEELLNGDDEHFYNEFGMQKHVFKYLVTVLRQNAGLGDTRHITLEEQLGIFLYTTVTGASNRKVKERFQRSSGTVSKCAQAFCVLWPTHLAPPQIFSPHFECTCLTRHVS